MRLKSGSSVLLCLAANVFAQASFAQASLAQSASYCGPRDLVLSRLEDKYGETRQSLGLGNNNRLMELFASSKTGTWTITATHPSGQTCLIATGQSFEAVATPKPSKAPI